MAMRKRTHGEEEEDTVSQLPDSILDYILRLMPLKSAMRTIILSRRWKDLCRCHWVWKDLCRCHWAHATTLDFTQEPFRSIQTPQQFVGTIDRCLQLHSGIDIVAFRVSFYPYVEYQSHIEKWIKFAVERRVKELDIDLLHLNWWFLDIECKTSFELPPCLFNCDSLIILKLTSCSFNIPLNFNGFISLKTIYFKQVEITDDILQRVLLNCPMLEELTLWKCNRLKSVHISSSLDLKLKRLSVMYCYGNIMDISAPNLLSFHLNCVSFHEYSLKNVSKMKDAIIHAVYRDGDSYYGNQTMILNQVSHAQILTLGDSALENINMVVYKGYPGDLPIKFSNLIELQLLITCWSDYYLAGVYALFGHCSFPYLEKLFIELDRDVAYPFEGKEPPACVFHNLKMIKVRNFQGYEIDMKLVKFLLNKAVALESLVLIIPTRRCIYKNSMLQTESCEASLRVLNDQLLLLPRASSDAKILLCKYSNDDNSSHPTHIEVYDWLGCHNFC